MDHPSPTPDTEQGLSLRRALAADLSPDMVELILAGARARDLSDECERLGLAAVLIDGSGRVLHVATAALAWFGKGVDLVAGHLIGRTRADNAALETAVNAALGSGNRLRDVAEIMAGSSLGVRGLPYRDVSPYQLLRGVLIFSAPQDELAVAALRGLLPA